MRLIILVLVLFLTGCSTLDGLIKTGAEINDNIVKNSILGLCVIPSLGSIEREFNTKAKEKARSDMCIKVNATVPIILN